MLSKRNYQERIRQMVPKKERFSIRKFSIGAASVLIGFTFVSMAGSHKVQAADVADKSVVVDTFNKDKSQELTENKTIAMPKAEKTAVSSVVQKGASANKIEAENTTQVDKNTEGSVKVQENKDAVQPKTVNNENVLNVSKAQSQSNEAVTKNAAESKVQVFAALRAFRAAPQATQSQDASDFQSLVNAMNDSSIGTINITNDITITGKVNGLTTSSTGDINKHYLYLQSEGSARDLTINGNGHRINFAGYSIALQNKNYTNAANPWNITLKDMTIEGSKYDYSPISFYGRKSNTENSKLTFDGVTANLNDRPLVDKYGENLPVHFAGENNITLNNMSIGYNLVTGKTVKFDSGNTTFNVDGSVDFVKIPLKVTEKKYSEELTPSYPGVSVEQGKSDSVDPSFKDENDKAADAPAGTKYTAGENTPDWIKVDPDTGKVTVSPTDDTSVGSHDISVTVTYPDSSTDQLTVPVTVTEKSNLAEKYPVSYDKLNVEKPSGDTPATGAVDPKAAADMPEGAITGYEKGDFDAPAGVTIDVNHDTGKVTASVGKNATLGSFEVPVKVTYSDGTYAEVKVPVSITGNKVDPGSGDVVYYGDQSMVVFNGNLTTVHKTTDSHELSAKDSAFQTITYYSDWNKKGNIVSDYNKHVIYKLSADGTKYVNEADATDSFDASAISFNWQKGYEVNTGVDNFSNGSADTLYQLEKGAVNSEEQTDANDPSGLAGNSKYRYDFSISDTNVLQKLGLSPAGYNAWANVYYNFLGATGKINIPVNYGSEVSTDEAGIKNYLATNSISGKTFVNGNPTGIKWAENGMPGKDGVNDAINRYVTRTIIVKEPGKEPQTITQTVHFTNEDKDGNSGYKDPVTGEIKYNTDWHVASDLNAKTGSWEEYTAPSVTGYTPSQAKVEAKTVTAETEAASVTISYTKNADIPVPFDPSNKDMYREVTRTINVVDPITGKISTSVQTAKFTREDKNSNAGYTDPVTGKTTMNPWTPAKQGLRAVNVEQIKGYVAKVDGNVDAVVVTPDSANMVVTITYQANKPEGQNITVKKDTVPDPADGIKNKDDLPDGTKYTWKEVPDVNSVGEKTGIVTVTFPDGTSVDVKVTVYVDPVVESNRDTLSKEANTGNTNVAKAATVTSSKVESKKTLPQTGSKTEQVGILGLAIATVGSLLGLGVNRKKRQK